MTELLPPTLAWAAGSALGLIFYGGLWWTVVIGTGHRRPGLVFLGSSLLRTGIVVAGLYFVSNGRWQPLLAALLGFVMARVFITWLTRPAKTVPPRDGHGAGRAS